MKRGRRAKAACRGVHGIVGERAGEGGDGARGGDATGSQRKITVSQRGSRASRVGSFPFPWMGWTAGTRTLAALCCEERHMTTTFQKRQKEMKRIEKPKMKEENRAQRKLDKPPPTQLTSGPPSH